MSLDINLEDARKSSTSPRRSRRESKGTQEPKASPDLLYQLLTNVKNSLACSDWRSAAYYADLMANCFAELPEGVRHNLIDFDQAPGVLGTWSTGDWIAYAVHLAYQTERLVPRPKLAPFSRECPPRIALVHGGEE